MLRSRFRCRPVAALALALCLLGCGEGVPAVGAAPPVGSGEAARRATPLNVLLITADDLGLQVGAYGDPVIETPRIDALAAGGVQFEVAWVTQASCSSSRSSMLTGLHAWATGQSGLVETGLSLAPELADDTLPNRLAAAGYRTGIIGKLHVAPADSFRFDFEEIDPGLSRDSGWVTGKADRFLSEVDASPFFLMVNYGDPHVARVAERAEAVFIDRLDGVPAELVRPSEKTILPFQQVDTREIRARTAAYYNSVKRLDQSVGDLMALMARRGHEEDTLVVFVSDHGPPFARAKTSVYEAGLRVPFIVHWPGVSRPRKSRALVSTLDLMPTILDAAGLPIPDGLHGRSLRPLLSDPDARGREYLVGEFNFHARDDFYPRRAIRNRHYKLIHNLLAGRLSPATAVDDDPAYEASQAEGNAGRDARQAFRTFADPPEFELYALVHDPAEFRNLAGRAEYYGVEHELKAELLAYRKRAADPFLDPDQLEAALAFSREPPPDRRPWWRRLLDGS